MNPSEIKKVHPELFLANDETSFCFARALNKSFEKYTNATLKEMPYLRLVLAGHVLLGWAR